MEHRVIVYPSCKFLSNNDNIRRINICKECVSEHSSIFVCYDIEKSSLSDDFKMLLLKHTNLVLISCNFRYKTMFQEKQKYKNLLMDNIFSNDLRSFIGNMLSPTSDSDISTLNSDTELDTISTHLVLGFFIYNPDALDSNEPLMCINSDVKKMRIMYPQIRIILILQGIRDMAIHFGKCDSKIPINSGEIDDLICRLLISYQVDTVETRDFNESFEYLFKTCNTILNAPSYHEFNMFRSSHVLSKNISSTKCGDDDLDIYERIWVNQLMQIPGLGESGATIIAQQYKTPLELINAATSNHLSKELENMQIPSSKGHRKLGPVLANR